MCTDLARTTLMSQVGYNYMQPTNLIVTSINMNRVCNEPTKFLMFGNSFFSGFSRLTCDSTQSITFSTAQRRDAFQACSLRIWGFRIWRSPTLPETPSYLQQFCLLVARLQVRGVRGKLEQHPRPDCGDQVMATFAKSIPTAIPT